MKGIVLHGENTVASRQKLNTLIDEFKKKGYEIIRLDEPKQDELILKSRSTGLFEENKCLVVERFISGNKDLEETPENDVIYWENRQLTPATVKKLVNLSLQEFKLPSTLFPLLDNVYPSNIQRLLTMYKESNLEPELVFAMLARTIRLLLWAKLDPSSLSLPSWQAGKLKSQASKFTELQLRDLHTKLLKIDHASKTSKLPEDLSSSLELLFANL